MPLVFLDTFLGHVLESFDYLKEGINQFISRGVGLTTNPSSPKAIESEFMFLIWDKADGFINQCLGLIQRCFHTNPYRHK